MRNYFNVKCDLAVLSIAAVRHRLGWPPDSKEGDKVFFLAPGLQPLLA